MGGEGGGGDGQVPTDLNGAFHTTVIKFIQQIHPELAGWLTGHQEVLGTQVFGTPPGKASLSPDLDLEINVCWRCKQQGLLSSWEILLFCCYIKATQRLQ